MGAKLFRELKENNHMESKKNTQEIVGGIWNGRCSIYLQTDTER